MLEGFLHGALRDLIKSHTTDAVWLIVLLFFLLGLDSVAQLLGQVPRDGLALAVRVRGQVDVVGGQGQLLQLGENLLLTRNDDVFRLEIVVDVDAQRALGQILDVPERSFDSEALAQIFLDSLGLSRRLDNYQTFRQCVLLIGVTGCEASMNAVVATSEAVSSWLLAFSLKPLPCQGISQFLGERR